MNHPDPPSYSSIEVYVTHVPTNPMKHGKPSWTNKAGMKSCSEIHDMMLLYILSRLPMELKNIILVKIMLLDMKLSKWLLLLIIIYRKAGLDILIILSLAMDREASKKNQIKSFRVLIKLLAVVMKKLYRNKMKLGKGSFQFILQIYLVRIQLSRVIMCKKCI